MDIFLDWLKRSPCNDQPFNENTHYLDGSAIYGSNLETNENLRAFRKGLLSQNQYEDVLLPFRRSTCQNSTGVGNKILFPNAFVAGDNRVNETPLLSSMHTFWVMEHNRLAIQIRQLFPSKKDEELFQEARRYVVAQWQNVIYSEWLPIGEANYLGWNLRIWVLSLCQMSATFSATLQRFLRVMRVLISECDPSCAIVYLSKAAIF